MVFHDDGVFKNKLIIKLFWRHTSRIRSMPGLDNFIILRLDFETLRIFCVI